MPSRDVFRLLHQVLAREGRPFIAVAREYYNDWKEHNRDFSLAFVQRFDVELNRIKDRLDMSNVPMSQILGLVLRIIRGDESVGDRAE